MLQHSRDQQLEQYSLQWRPNFIGVVVCVTWLVMSIKQAVIIDFIGEPRVFACYFFALFPVVYCVERVIREFGRCMSWLFGWLFMWVEDLVKLSSLSDDIALPFVFSTTSVILTVILTMQLFFAAMLL